MSIIRLRTVNYLNWKGLVLTPDNPFVEATKENLEKLKPYIDSGYLSVILDEEMTAESTEQIEVDAPMSTADCFAEENAKLEGLTTTISRIYEYSKDELKEMNKAQLLAICEDRKLEVKKSFSVAKLEEIILKNQ